MRWYSREACRDVDREVIEHYGLPGIVLMEHAAIALRDRATAMLEGGVGPVVVSCGPGNNGGDGYALARLLHGATVEVRAVALAPPGDPESDAAVNARAAAAFGVPIDPFDTKTPLPGAALLVDAIFGTGLASAPRGAAARFIDAINAHPARTLSADVPSGLDADTGEALGACVRADETVTFVGLKLGLANPASRAHTGRVTVGDIGAPRELVERFGVERA